MATAPSNPSPDKNFLILSLARCGSTILMKALALHPCITCVHEPFNTVAHPELQSITAAELLRLKVEELRTQYTGIKHVWDPEGRPFGNDRLNLDLATLPGHRILYLRRRNVLKRLVSIGIAKQTKVWHVEQPKDVKQIRKIRFRPLDTDLIRAELAIESRSADFLEALRAAGCVVRTVWYEDFCDAESGDAAAQAIAEIIEWLGFGEPNLQTRSGIATLLSSPAMYRNTAETYRQIPGIEEVERTFGSDETGWLFR